MEAIERSGISPACERDLGRETAAECTLEYTLPDYMPEIRKILRVDAKAIEGGRYIEEGRAEFSGIVAFTVLYSGAEGRPTALSLNGDFSVSAPTAAPPTAAYLSAEVESAVCRPLGPRRLSLRAQLRTSLHLLTDTLLPLPEAEGCERLVSKLHARRTVVSESGEIAVQDTLSIPGIPPDSLHPLFCDGSIAVEDCRVTDGGCMLRAVLHTRVMVVSEEGRPICLSGRIPIERELAADGAREGDAPLASGQILSLAARLSADGEGGTLVELDGSCECRARFYRNEVLTPTVSMYSPACRSEVTRCQVKSESFVGAAGGQYTVSGGAAVTSEERASLVLDSAPLVTVKKITEEGGRPIVLGEVRVRMLVAAPPPEEGPTPCFSVEYTHPFRIEAPIRLPAGRELRYECSVTPVFCRARIEEGGYADDTELALSLAVFAPGVLSAVSDIRLFEEEPYPVREATLTVVYPREGDTLFSVAERYHTTPAALALTNRLGEMTNEAAAEPCSLEGIGFLLVE